MVRGGNRNRGHRNGGQRPNNAIPLPPPPAPPAEGPEVRVVEEPAPVAPGPANQPRGNEHARVEPVVNNVPAPHAGLPDDNVAVAPGGPTHGAPTHGAPVAALVNLVAPPVNGVAAPAHGGFVRHRPYHRQNYHQNPQHLLRRIRELEEENRELRDEVADLARELGERERFRRFLNEEGLRQGAVERIPAANPISLVWPHPTTASPSIQLVPAGYQPPTMSGYPTGYTYPHAQHPGAQMYRQAGQFVQFI